ncbi:MAG: 16S rRNA (cytidine(1402)-2'-O)-methyltransferase [Coriobacteriia bacterium]|nr:16S rRNA (cytidine(1402)-2'-O)-methyltransferase [Coriobacteriia bacterium]
MAPESGRLSVCATPIGNLGDVTLRVIETLRGADVILAEDTRVTHKLLAHYDITTPLERFDEHTAARRTPEVVSRVRAGAWLALVSDAGTPGVSDPGSTLVAAALDAGVLVEVLPGASAVPAALVASGLPTHAFYFGGFLPRKAGERRRLFDGLASLDATLVFYESPHRTAVSLMALAEAFPARTGAMARELTKLHEEVVRAPLPELAAQIGARETLKGEVVLLVGPPAAGEAEVEIDEAAVRARVDALVATGASRNAAVKTVAGELGLARNAVYAIAHAKS